MKKVVILCIAYGVAEMAGMARYSGLLAGAVPPDFLNLFQGAVYIVLRMLLLVWVPIYLMGRFLNRVLEVYCE